MGSGLEENASISKEIRSKFEDLELQPRKAAGAVEALEPSDDGRNSVYKEESENRGRENRGTSNPSSGSDVVAERPEVEGHGRMDEAADGAADEQDGIQDDADVLEASEPGSPLDPDMIQLAKERNKAAGICDACQELFAAICTVGSDREGGKALAPAGYEKYDEGSSYILWPKGDKPTLHNFAHDTLPALTVSAKTGCGTCRMLLESLRVYSSPKYCEPSSDWFVAASYKKFKGHDQWLIWLHSKESSIEKADGYRLDLIPTYANHFKQSRSSFGQFEQNPFPDSLPSASPEIPRHSLESLPLAKIWLNHCEVNHRSCNTSRTVANSFFPTRLLFVGEAIPRLCLTSTLPRSRPLRYSALSHCWGSLDGLICLTAQNLVAFQNIPAPALCKTFRDAIEITKALGLDYLWIDSLCIIQDDVGDWTSEAGLMCEVYSCCAVSIAASSALNGNGGCLFSRDPERCWAQPLEMIQNRKLVECSLLNTGIRMQCVDDVPLSTRAWVLQEHMLAPRTVHFSSTQIFWECREQEACESLPRGIMIYSLNPSLKTSLEWKVIVEDYSSRDLTFADDKLPALAGLAQKFQKETKYTYVAGLWLETLAWNLLWAVRAVFFVNEKPKYPKAAARLHSAPSWSWASVDCMVDLQEPKETYRIADMTHHSFVLDVEGLPPGNDSFGHVRRAILNVECEVLIPVWPAERSSSGTLHRPFHYTRVNDMKRFAFFANLDYKYVTNGVKYLLPLYTLIESSSDGKYRDGAYTLSEPKGTQIVVGGLILEQIGQWYRRIGTFRPNFRWQENVKDWIQLTKTFIPDLRETDYERRYIDEKTGHERCTIKII